MIMDEPPVTKEDISEKWDSWNNIYEKMNVEEVLADIKKAGQPCSYHPRKKRCIDDRVEFNYDLVRTQEQMNAVAIAEVVFATTQKIKADEDPRQLFYDRLEESIKQSVTAGYHIKPNYWENDFMALEHKKGLRPIAVLYVPSGQLFLKNVEFTFCSPAEHDVRVYVRSDGIATKGLRDGANKVFKALAEKLGLEFRE